VSAVQVFGVVIAELPTPGADRTVVIFTNERGRLIVRARGAKKPMSKLAPAIQTLTSGTFHLAAAGKALILSGAQVRSFHRKLQTSLATLSVAQAIAEVIDRTLPLDEPAPDAFRLAMNCLGALERGIAPDAVLAFFLAKTVGLLGVAPSAAVLRPLYAMDFNDIGSLSLDAESIEAAVAVLRGALERFADAKIRSLDFALEMVAKAKARANPGG
jgi:recombinational DNA repair protein (RecF pathway)